MKQIDTIPPPPPRPDDAHKGTFGSVIIIGGCDTMLGAPALTARAALRSGVGLVKIACPPNLIPHTLTIEPSATGIALTEGVGSAIAQIEQADPGAKAVLAIGPGLGQHHWHGELISALLSGPRTIVLDADGLNRLASEITEKRSIAVGCPLVITPHPGEYRRLTDALKITADPVGDEAERTRAASLLANRLNAVVLLKGQHTVIADTQRFTINHTGNPALATAGSGDVLTGIIASLIAQGMSTLDAARLGAHVHGLAADRWAEQHGRRGLRAVELADALPGIFNQLSQRLSK